MKVAQYLPPMSPLMMMGVILLSLLHSADGKLEIRRNDSPAEAFLGQNVTLPCHFSGYEGPSLDLTTVSVRWSLKTSLGDKQVYWFHGGERTQDRPGSDIPEDNLVRGDGSLYISNVQISDEGEYTCTVIVTPDKATSTFPLQLLAQPTCAVSDSRLEMKPHMDGSVTCYVNGFYPDDAQIHWRKRSKDFTEPVIDTHISRPVKNQGGIYSATSILSVKPVSTDEDGDVYSCVVTHRSLKDDLTCDVSLSVTADKSPVWILVGLVITLVPLFLVGLFCYFCLKVPPEVVQMPKPDLNHEKKTMWNIIILNFRPKNLTLKLYLKDEVVASWSSVNPKAISEENRTEQNMPLQPVNEVLCLSPQIKSQRWLSYCLCSIYIIPNIKLHDGAKLTLEVHHPALKKPLRALDVKLNVQSPPKLEPIQANKTSYSAGDEVELTCKIHSFYPETINVEWFKNGKSFSEQYIKGKADGSGFCSAEGSVRREVEEEDFNSIFKYTVTHQSGWYQSEEWTLK